MNRDVPVLQGAILSLALIFVATNLAGGPAAGGDRPAGAAGMMSHRWTARRFPIQAAPVRCRRGLGYWGMVGRRLRRDPVTVVFCLLMLAIVLSAVFAPLLSPFDPYKDSIILRLKPFGFRGHWLGTDELGRDHPVAHPVRRADVAADGRVPVLFAGWWAGRWGSWSRDMPAAGRARSSCG